MNPTSGITVESKTNTFAPANLSRVTNLDLKFLTDSQKVVTIAQTLVEQHDCIWARHIYDLAEEEKTSSYYAIITKTTQTIPLIRINHCEWGQTEKYTYIHPRLAKQNIWMAYQAVPNLFLYWLAEEKFTFLNDHAPAIDPENVITTVGQPIVLNCIDFVYLTLYLAQLTAKDEIKNIYKEQFKFENLQKFATLIESSGRGFDKISNEVYAQKVDNETPLTWYGIDLGKKRSYAEAQIGDLILVFNNELSRVPDHCFIFGGEDTGVGAWQFPAVSGGCRYFAQKFSINTAVKEAREYAKCTYTLYAYPLKELLRQ